MPEARIAPAVAAALGQLLGGLSTRFGPRLREVTLFGSHARGAAHEDSDVDVLVVVDGLTEGERRDIFDMCYDVDSGSPDWVGLMPLAYSTAQAADLRSRERLLMREIDRDGVRL